MSWTDPAAPKLNTVLAYPNPAVNQDPVIRAMVGIVNGLDITIFDASGQVVHGASLGATPSGIANGQYYYDYTWTGRKASGIYSAVIHGKAADGTIIHARVRFAVILRERLSLIEASRKAPPTRRFLPL